ncbi:DUF305 domain-containing protein [Nitrobacter sp.]|uniref:DUF305 domain-containing protein n=1 Tax=Nitrobacter sp. TaxID=29420 RepID=UPI00321F79AC
MNRPPNSCPRMIRGRHLIQPGTAQTSMYFFPEVPMSYRRFFAMIAVSTVVMFVLMYLNTYALEHVRFSETRVYMALLMGAAMAVVMLGFMLGMYKSYRLNAAILVIAVIVFGTSLWLMRSQQTIGDVAYMKAMIPHHSIAIMTSERAHIKDPEVRRLADGIIDAQVREIVEMERHISRLQANPPAANATDLKPYREREAKPPSAQTDENTAIDTTKIPR